MKNCFKICSLLILFQIPAFAGMTEKKETAVLSKEGNVFLSASKAQPLKGRAMKREKTFPSLERTHEDDPETKDYNLGDKSIVGTTATIDFSNFDVNSSGNVTLVGGINLSGGTAGAANTIDFGNGANDDLTATDVTDLTDGGTTSLHSHPALGIFAANTLDDGYNGDTSGDAQITVDARDISIDLNDAVNDYKFSIDNTTGGVITTAMEIVTSGVGGAFLNGIDVSDGGITNAILVGANDIEGTTATITFTDFQVSNDGNVTLAPDSAGTALTITTPAAAAQGIVIDATTNSPTCTDGLIDINFTSSTSLSLPVSISVVSDEGAATNADIFGINMMFTNNDADAQMTGVAITSANSSVAASGSYETLLKLVNNDASASLSQGILVLSSGVDGGIVDGLDVSDPNLTNALRASTSLSSQKFIVGTTAVIDFTYFDVGADGNMAISSATANSTVMMDLTHDASTGTVTDGLSVAIGTGAALTNGVNVSDPDIVNALNIGANNILVTTAMAVDISGAGDSTLTFKNTSGTIKIAFVGADDDFRVASQSPANNGNGLYYDTSANKLCVDDDDGTDRCTSSMALAAQTLTEDEVKKLKKIASFVKTFDQVSTENKKMFFSILKNPQIMNLLSAVASGKIIPKNMKAIEKKTGLKPEELKKLSLMAQKIKSVPHMTSFLTESQEDALLKLYEDALLMQGDFTVEDSKTGHHVLMDEKPMIVDRGKAQLNNGMVRIDLAHDFIELTQNDDTHPLYTFISPADSSIQGVLSVTERGKDYFTVEEIHGHSNGWFFWEAEAEQKF